MKLPATTFLILLPITASLFIGCATSYKRDGYGGGYSHTQLAPGLFRVTFTGNGYTSAQRAQDFALLRAAELAQESGHTHLIVLREQTDKNQRLVGGGGGTSYTSGVATRVGQTTFYNANTIHTDSGPDLITFPSATVGIQCLKQPEPGALEVGFLLDSLRTKYKLSVPKTP